MEHREGRGTPTNLSGCGVGQSCDGSYTRRRAGLGERGAEQGGGYGARKRARAAATWWQARRGVAVCGDCKVA